MNNYAVVNQSKEPRVQRSYSVGSSRGPTERAGVQRQRALPGASEGGVDAQHGGGCGSGDDGDEVVAEGAAAAMVMRLSQRMRRSNNVAMWRIDEESVGGGFDRFFVIYSVKLN
nr:hypothetical protein Iba_chr12aCG11840 [Ipomoea batatas]